MCVRFDIAKVTKIEIMTCGIKTDWLVYPTDAALHSDTALLPHPMMCLRSSYGGMTPMSTVNEYTVFKVGSRL